MNDKIIEYIKKELKDMERYEKESIKNGDLINGYEDVLKWESNVEFDAGRYYCLKEILHFLERGDKNEHIKRNT